MLSCANAEELLVTWSPNTRFVSSNLQQKKHLDLPSPNQEAENDVSDHKRACLSSILHNCFLLLLLLLLIIIIIIIIIVVSIVIV